MGRNIVAGAFELHATTLKIKLGGSYPSTDEVLVANGSGELVATNLATRSETLTNKTINATDNTLTATSAATGDLLVHNGTKFVRVARGASAGMVLAVNSGGTDIAWSKHPAVASVAMGALEIDWSAGCMFTKTLGAGSNTLTFANATDGQVIDIFLTGEGTSTTTWPTMKWAAGTPPTQTVGGRDWYRLAKAGADIHGAVIAQNMS